MTFRSVDMFFVLPNDLQVGTKLLPCLLPLSRGCVRLGGLQPHKIRYSICQHSASVFDVETELLTFGSGTFCSFLSDVRL